MYPHILRQSSAWFVSGLVHAGIFGALAIVGNSDPVAWTTRNGRASIALVASMAASPEADVLVELIDVPIDARASLKKTDTKAESVLTQQDRPALEIGPRLELPKPAGRRTATAPAVVAKASTTKGQKLPELAKRPEQVVARPPEVQPNAKPAAVASKASMASQASAGNEMLPRQWTGNPEIQWPAAAKALYSNYPGIVLVVKLRVTISERGTVSAARVHASSGVQSLDSAAVEGIRVWRFEPGRRGGRTVAMDVIQPVNFKVELR